MEAYAMPTDLTSQCVAAQIQGLETWQAQVASPRQRQLPTDTRPPKGEGFQVAEGALRAPVWWESPAEVGILGQVQYRQVRKDGG